MAVASPDRPQVSSVEAKGMVRIAVGMEKEKVAFAGRNPAEGANLAKVAELIRDQEAKVGLETLATGFNHRATFQKTAEQQVKTGFNKDGDRQARNSSEDEDAAKVLTATRRYIDYLRDGFDGLEDDATVRSSFRSSFTGQPAFEKRNYLISQVGAFITSNPGLVEAVAGDSGQITQGTLVGILRKPAFRNLLAQRLNEMYDPENLPADLEQKLIAAENKFNTADREAGRLKEEKDKLSDRKTEVDGKKVSFERRFYSSSSGGGERKDINLSVYSTDSVFDSIGPLELESDTRTTKESVYQALSQDREITSYLQAKQRLQQLHSLASGNRQDRNELEEQRKLVVSMELNSKVSEYNFLDSQKKAIDRELKEVSDGLIQVEFNLLAKKGERIAAKTERDNLVHQRQAQSSEFVSGIENAVRDAAGEYLTQRVKELISKYPEYRANIEEAAQKEADEKLKAHLEARWLEPQTRLYKEKWLKFIQKTWGYSKSKTERDINEILHDSNGNPDALIKKVLTGAKVDFGTIDLLMNDKVFMETQRVSIVGKLLAARVASGGKISGAMLDLLRVSSWGKEASAKWIENNPEAKAEVEALTGKPVSKESLEEIHKKKGKKGVLLALLLALGLSTAMGMGSLKG